MDQESLDFIFSALPKGRTVFYDFQDRYAILLLSKMIGEEGKSISEIKESDFAPLLRKPCVQELISNLGKPNLKASDLLSAWPSTSNAYRLTLGNWPDLGSQPNPVWNQVTRWGWNLVLQLNLSESHKRELQELVPNWRDWVDDPIHPIADLEELTLAWSRIDLDFDSGEALIEEIQSDWIRDVKYQAENRRIKDQSAWSTYYEQILMPQAKKWSETMLTATLWFLLEELGINTIFFHTYDSGNKLKRIDNYYPPRSIYSDLPRKFCFQTTHNGPLFIRDSARKELRRIFSDPETKWYVLDFD